MLQSVFLAAAETIVPACVALSGAHREALLRIPLHALRSRPVMMRRQLAILLWVIECSALPRWGSVFTRLDAAARDRHLRWFQDCPFELLRKGFWGLKVLVYMGYYGQPDLAARCGYAVTKSGNEMLHG
ncbi:MAG: hypothetical protein AABZ44_04095 [Elusimicrobiota bacterium]